MEIQDRLGALRGEMAKQGVQAALLPTGDPHLSEYIPAHWESRRWFSGFTGDAGTLVVTEREALLWADGRFFIQAARQLEGTGITLMRMGQPGVPAVAAWLGMHCRGMRVAVDGAVCPADTAKKIEAQLRPSGASLVDLDLVGPVWVEGRPPQPATPVYALADRFAGESCAEKLAQVRAALQEAGADAQFYSRLDDVAWITNLRAADIPYNPFALSYLLVTQRAARLYLDGGRLQPDAAAMLKRSGVEVLPYALAAAGLRGDFGANRILVDPAGTSLSLFRCLWENPAVTVVEGDDVAARLKAVKNPIELENLRACHIYDGVALLRFRMELAQRMGRGECLTEWDAAQILHRFRAGMPHSRGESFETIAAYGPNAAMMHYAPTARQAAPLEPHGLLLLDSGGQYDTGTTDVTRTFALGPLTDAEKRCFTWVLQAHIALAAAVFPEGTHGGTLDGLAREKVWRHGLDYRCATGHGVGYFGAVHEGPQCVRANSQEPLRPGMLMTDEPGLYMEGSFGIRTENVLEVVAREKTEYGNFCAFEPVTWFPIDRAAVLPELLSPEELAYLDGYHRTVYQKLSPELGEAERMWLQAACAPFGEG